MKTPPPNPLERAQRHRRLSPREATDVVTTSLVLPRKLHEAATLAATRLNCSLAQLIRDALEAHLARLAPALKEARP